MPSELYSIKLVSLFILSWITLLPTKLFADECSDILKVGIFDRYESGSLDKFDEELSKVASMSERELKESSSSKKGGGSVVMEDLIDLRFRNESNNQLFRQFSKSWAVNESLAVQSSAYRSIQVQLVNEFAVKNWRDCMIGRKTRIDLAGNTNKENGEFIATIENTPANLGSVQKLKIKSVAVSGGEVVGKEEDIEFKKGVEIAPFSGISQVYKRVGSQEFSISVNFEDAPSVSNSLHPPDDHKEPDPGGTDVIEKPAIIGLAIVGGRPKNKVGATPDGYKQDPNDLNEGAHGDYIYLCTKKGTPNKDSKPITGIYVLEGNSKDLTAPTGYTKINFDLNRKAGGKYIYLCYTTETTLNPLRDMTVIMGDNSNVPAPEGYEKKSVDLNTGAGGKYIYFVYRR